MTGAGANKESSCSSPYVVTISHYNGDLHNNAATPIMYFKNTAHEMGHAFSDGRGNENLGDLVHSPYPGHTMGPQQPDTGPKDYERRDFQRIQKMYGWDSWDDYRQQVLLQ